jgi:hypothetical protein
MEVLDKMNGGAEGSNERHIYEELLAAQKALSSIKS